MPFYCEEHKYSPRCVESIDVNLGDLIQLPPKNQQRPVSCYSGEIGVSEYGYFTVIRFLLLALVKTKLK